MKYEVPIVYRGLSTYIVEATSPEEATRKALRKFENGEVADPLGNEWEEVERVGEVEQVPESESAETMIGRHRETALKLNHARYEKEEEDDG